ncbi:DUF423 domain-containing protein [Roseivirga thermotolerans]|uniref:Membrane protein n=1 Tax=Roseivirga thermotolerans TaxID=1758176 RepID=A0ABQ3I948_9BACT|nr:DUF423 domain-containing protein [Roseivirga thermotolerans]GHE66706.1 membrane protein [Roseivirga thermotolerans]
MTAKTVIILAGVLGALSVGLEAFGAHGLEATLTANGRIETYETAVKYQFYHTLALLLVGLIMLHTNTPYFSYASWAFVAGILVFSGSLYTLSLTNITWLGAITPIGGLAFIAGWIFLLIGANKAL